MAQIRLAVRTPRGRSTLVAPVLTFVVLLTISKYASAAAPAFLPEDDIALATLGAFISLMSVLPLAMNQFAIDGPGLTLELLAPLKQDDLLIGKAAANGVIGGTPAILCVLVTGLMVRSGDPALWISVPLGLLATYVVVAPIAAFGSLMFPRAVNLNSIGNGSNAHGVAGLLGLIGFIAAGVPPLGLALAATRWLERPALAPLFLAGWCVAAFGLARLLLVPLRALLDRRRENLSLVARSTGL